MAGLRTLMRLLLILGTIPFAETRFRHYKWGVKYEHKSPDRYEKLMITINGRSPGPTIMAQQNDRIIVELKNSSLTENVAIHWHGIRQRVAGPYGSIRDALPDGESEPFSYDNDRSIILQDWYNKSTYEQATGLSSIPFGWVGEPQSLLIQGRGRFDCSTPGIEAGLCNATNPECSPYVITVVPGKTYRLRISSLTGPSTLSFKIEGHNMTVVATDGHCVEPFVAKNLFIYSGVTYSVLIKTDQDPSRNYWASSTAVSRDRTTSNGLAIFNYYPNHPRKSPPTVPPPGPAWNDSAPRVAQSFAIKARQGYIYPPPQTSDRVIVLLNTKNMFNGYYWWSVNNVSYNFPHTPYLIVLKENLEHVFDQTPPPTGYESLNYDIYSPPKNPNATTSNSIYRLQFNSVVDIVLQNANSLKNHTSEAHPWLLHGHDFWVMGYGLGKFDMVNPITKNTVPIHPYGWTALRFRANNPGVWAFHCHIESHFYMGMGVVFEEGI